jgi:decaprenylphospho-beta-D-ribofuranose 2-oxidase
MQISGWGRYPVIDSEERAPLTPTDLRDCLRDSFTGIARGMGRSYGDSALAPTVLSTAYLNHILDFDPVGGVLRCQAGVTVADILDTFAGKGWFPPVTPGTKYVSIGGCVASDVHGKNHHREGSFCDHVISMTVMLADGETRICTPGDTPELFHATCGGMGLTGVILDVTFKMKKIHGCYIQGTTHKARRLDEALDLLESRADSPYSVAWIDTLSRGPNRGRSLVMLGEHLDDGDVSQPRRGALAVPLDMPAFLLNHRSIRAFNALYYHRVKKTTLAERVHYEQFFYPLDKILNWNRLYGKRGFTQYQFVMPKAGGKEGIAAVLKHMTDAERGSFLAVLKAFGRGNDNYLSFPMEGYTLAVDFKLDDGLFGLLDQLDRIVLDHGGRLYLTKDARMGPETFKRGYPRWESFQKARRAVGADTHFRSLQSQRLGI